MSKTERYLRLYSPIAAFLIVGFFFNNYAAYQDMGGVEVLVPYIVIATVAIGLWLFINPTAKKGVKLAVIAAVVSLSLASVGLVTISSIAPQF